MNSINALMTVLLATVVVVAGCDQNSVPVPEDKGRPIVALIMKSLANEFFVEMARAAEKHQADHAGQYTLIVNGLKDESDIMQQVVLIEQMIARNVDAIVIAPADSKALMPALRRAVQSGIVVVNIDNRLDKSLLDESGAAIPFVGPDNRDGARLAGEYLAKFLSQGDKVVIIGGVTTMFNAQERQKGFEEAMQHAGIQVVDIQAGNWEQAKASSIAAALISEHADLKGILCSNDNMALGAIAAVRQAGKIGRIQVVGFDNINATQEVLESGELLATVDQHGDQFAIHGIEYALQVLDDGNVPLDKETPVRLITASGQ